MRLSVCLYSRFVVAAPVGLDAVLALCIGHPVKVDRICRSRLVSVCVYMVHKHVVGAAPLGLDTVVELCIGQILSVCVCLLI